MLCTNLQEHTQCIEGDDTQANGQRHRRAARQEGELFPWFRQTSQVSKSTILYPIKKHVDAKPHCPEEHRQAVGLCFTLRAMGSHWRILTDNGVILSHPISLSLSNHPPQCLWYLWGTHFQGQCSLHFRQLLKCITVMSFKPNSFLVTKGWFRFRGVSEEVYSFVLLGTRVQIGRV